MIKVLMDDQTNMSVPASSKARMVLPAAALCAIGAIGLLAGCPAAPPSTYAQFQSKDPGARVQALVEATKNKDANALPFIVERMTDSESDVRLFAENSLRTITGHTMGYHSYDLPQDRQQAQDRWRQWLKGDRKTFPPEPTTQTVGPTGVSPVGAPSSPQDKDANIPAGGPGAS
jgi:hypothetical protein